MLIFMAMMEAYSARHNNAIDLKGLPGLSRFERTRFSPEPLCREQGRYSRIFVAGAGA